MCLLQAEESCALTTSGVAHTLEGMSGSVLLCGTSSGTSQRRERLGFIANGCFPKHMRARAAEFTHGRPLQGVPVKQLQQSALEQPKLAAHRICQPISLPRQQRPVHPFYLIHDLHIETCSTWVRATKEDVCNIIRGELATTRGFS